MKPKLFIVTSSSLKFKELSLGLSEFFDCEQKTLDEPEIQGKPEAILRYKLTRAYLAFQNPVLVDDVSVDIEELGGFPGPYMKDFWKCLSPYEMGVKFAGSSINATCRLGLCRGEGDIVVAESTFHGKIVTPKDKDHKERWFELFVQLDGMDRLMIEYSIEEKNKFSHRGLAMKNLIKILKREEK